MISLNNDTSLKKKTTSDKNPCNKTASPLATLSKKAPPIPELQEHSIAVEFALCFMSLCLEAFPRIVGV